MTGLAGDVKGAGAFHSPQQSQPSPPLCIALLVGRDRRKKTGCRRRNVLKEDLVAEDRKTDFFLFSLTLTRRAPVQGPGHPTWGHVDLLSQRPAVPFLRIS